MEKKELDSLVKYAPEGQLNPAQYIKLISEQVLGTDRTGRSREVGDLFYFLELSKKTNLDPLAKQIYAVYRWDSRTGKEKMTPQVSIDGLRLIAQRTGQYAGQDDVEYKEKDDDIISATVTVYKIIPGSDKTMKVPATARWSEYAQMGKDGKPMKFWKEKPYLMLGKCAEALALRKAFPQETSSLYLAEELPSAIKEDDVIRENIVNAEKEYQGKIEDKVNLDEITDNDLPPTDFTPKIVK